jgi:transposase
VALLKQLKGVGTLIALTFLLTLEDAHRFRKSRQVGSYVRNLHRGCAWPFQTLCRWVFGKEHGFWAKCSY